MRIILMMGLILSSLPAYSAISKAPLNFKYKNSQAVFVDFTNADYQITYDVDQETAKATSIIQFEMDEEGMPIFDLLDGPLYITLGNDPVQSTLIADPDRETRYRVIEKVLQPGRYTLTIKNSFDRNLRFRSGTVASGFWMSDLSDRRYIEQYLPTNIEYDQYKSTLNVKVLNSKKEHEVFTNGALKQKTRNEFFIDFPAYFTASSFYFHLSEKGRFPREEFTFKSLNGANVPVIIYSKSSWTLSGLKQKTLDIMNELEQNFGAWSHPSITIYIAGQGGMEHAGATITSVSALGHELIHSFFARSVMPIDGNSGWMDEAIASWRDKGYKAVNEPSFSSTMMSGHSQYKRTTDRNAYSKGANFMAYLNNELKSLGGLKAFLKKIYSMWAHQNIFTSQFKKELEKFSGRDFTADFNQYIYGTTHVNDTGDKTIEENPYHPKLSKEQLLELL
jgi:hypothetical protein